MTETVNRLLLWAAAPADRGASIPVWMPQRLEPAASARLAARAIGEGLAGLVYQRLKKLGRLGMLSDDARRRLEAVYYLTLQTNLKHMCVLHEILALQRPVVPIQGAALLVQLYEDPGLRPLTDIDLWVPRGEKEHLLAALGRLGFRSNASTPGLLRRGDLLIDVHTHLLGAERIRSRRFLIGRSQEEIFKACRKLRWEGREVLFLDERDQVIFSTLHAVKHYFERLIWLADLARLVSTWEDTAWQSARQRAGWLGQDRVIDLLSYVLKTVLGCGLAARQAGSKEISGLAKYLLRSRRQGPLPRWSPLVLQSARGAMQQLEFMLESFFPRPAVLRQIFASNGDPGAGRLYRKRIRQLMVMLNEHGLACSSTDASESG
jgi:hypothetical protein